MTKIAKFLFNKQNSNICCIYQTWSKLHRAKLLRIITYSRSDLFLVNSYHQRFSSYASKNKIGKLHPSKVVVFGYVDPDFPTLQCIESERVITHEWFDGQGKDSVAVFFVPRGAKLLRDKPWATKFTRWVSFHEDYEFLTGLPIIDREGPTIYSKIFDVINKSDDPEQMTIEIKEIYANSIKRLALLKGENEHDVFEAIQQLKINNRNITSQ